MAKAIELEDIEARLAELERAAETSKPGWTYKQLKTEDAIAAPSLEVDHVHCGIGPESVFEIGKRLNELLMEAEVDSDGDGLPESARERIANVVEALRTRVVRRQERDLRSLFDLDEELIELMDRVEDATADGGEVPAELLQEVND